MRELLEPLLLLFQSILALPYLIHKRVSSKGWSCNVVCGVKSIVLTYMFRYFVRLIIHSWGSEPILGARGHCVLVLWCFVLVALDSIQESDSLVHYFFVFDWDHLVEIDRISFLGLVWHLVFESDRSWAEWLQVIPGAKLMIKNLQLVLDLSIIAARTWHMLDVWWNRLEDVSLYLSHKGCRHVQLWNP